MKIKLGKFIISFNIKKEKITHIQTTSGDIVESSNTYLMSEEREWELEQDAIVRYKELLKYNPKAPIPLELRNSEY
jgi:hypothetical protein